MILGAGGMTTVHCNCNRTLCVLRLVWQWLQCASKGLWEIDLRISVVGLVGEVEGVAGVCGREDVQYKVCGVLCVHVC